MRSKNSGKIITFYSYKGGVGRSMILANVAWILASNGKRVLALDWDLAAPGLHRYFHPFLLDKDLSSSEGVIDFFTEYEIEVATPTERAGEKWYVSYADVTPYAVSLNWDFPKPGTLDLVPAGRQNAGYSARVNSFDWHGFYERSAGGVFLEAVKDSMRSEYDYILIDSPSGVSDIAGITTIQMPDELVACFVYNHQNIGGTSAVLDSIGRQRIDNPLQIFPVPTRVEYFEMSQLQKIRDYAMNRLSLFQGYLPPDSRRNYWGDVEIPHYSYYSYTEMLATFGDQPAGNRTLLSSILRLTMYLTDGEISTLDPIPELERQAVLEQYQTITF